MERLKCPVCGRELEVRCADSPELFTAYDPMVGLECYGPYGVPKDVLHVGEYRGFRVVHIVFPGTGNEHLVILPSVDGDMLPMCRERFKALEESRRAWEEHCIDCCMKYCGGDEPMGSELCLCDCYSICEELDLDFGDDEDEWGDDEW